MSIDPWVERLAKASNNEVDGLVDTWAREFNVEAKRIAANICRTYNLDFTNHFDDALSLVWSEFLSVAKDVRSRGLRVFVPALLIKNRAHRAMMSFLDVEQAKGVTGNRKGPVRRRALSKAADELYAASGLMPERRQILEYAQEQANQRLKDPIRQSMVFSEADFSGLGFSSVDAHSDGVLSSADSDDIDSRIDVAWFARRVILVAATFRAEVLGAALMVWGNDGVVRACSSVDLSRALGVSTSSGLRLRRLVSEKIPGLVLQSS